MWIDVELGSIRMNLEEGSSGRDEGRVEEWRNENKQEEEEE